MNGARFTVLLGFVPTLLQACPTCGSAQELTLRVFLTGLGFVILPASFAAFIGYRVYKDEKSRWPTSKLNGNANGNSIEQNSRKT